MNLNCLEACNIWTLYLAMKKGQEGWPAHTGSSATSTLVAHTADRYFWQPLADTSTGLDTQNFLGYTASKAKKCVH